jgi:hypothetical protein
MLATYPSACRHGEFPLKRAINIPTLICCRGRLHFCRCYDVVGPQNASEHTIIYRSHWRANSLFSLLNYHLPIRQLSSHCSAGRIILLKGSQTQNKLTFGCVSSRQKSFVLQSVTPFDTAATTSVRNHVYSPGLDGTRP